MKNVDIILGSNVGAQESGAQLLGGSNCRVAQLSGLNCRGSTVVGSTVGVPFLGFSKERLYKLIRKFKSREISIIRKQIVENFINYRFIFHIIRR